MKICDKVLYFILIGIFFIGLTNFPQSYTVHSLENQENNLDLILVCDVDGYIQNFNEFKNYNNAIISFSISNSYHEEKSENILDDTSPLHDNWPKTLNLNYSNPIVTADVDNSGTDEIIVSTALNSDSEAIYVWNENGSLLSGWPKYVSAFTTHINTGDLNNDGFLEIICSTNNGLHVWDYTGQSLPGWPKYFGDAGHCLCDINNNLDLEIISTNNGQVYVWDYTGQSLPGWPVKVGTYASIPLVADFDGDIEKEVVSISKYYDGSSLTFNITMMNSTGSIVDGWPQTIQGVQFSNAVRAMSAGDIDNDNQLEIVFGDKEKIYVFNHDGTCPQGWPISRDGTGLLYPIVLSDVNSNGMIEIIEAEKVLSPTNASAEITVYDKDGDITQGFPIQINDYEIISSPVVADINYDGSQDFLIDCISGLVIYEIDGNQYSFYPSQGNDPGWRPVQSVSAAINDIDDDLFSEIIFASIDGVIHIEDVDIAPGFLSWPQYQHDFHHSGIYEPPLFEDILVSNIKRNWNLMSVPINESIDKYDFNLMIDNLSYTWNESVDNDFISNFIFGWNRNGQYYDFNNVIIPGYGYWLFSYTNFSLIIEDVQVIVDEFITNLVSGWNTVSIPYQNNVSKIDVLVNDESWDTAVSNGWISDYVFGWDRAGQYYDFADIFIPGDSYWVYASQSCVLKRDI